MRDGSLKTLSPSKHPPAQACRENVFLRKQPVRKGTILGTKLPGKPIVIIPSCFVFTMYTPAATISDADWTSMNLIPGTNGKVFSVLAARVVTSGRMGVRSKTGIFSRKTVFLSLYCNNVVLGIYYD